MPSRPWLATTPFTPALSLYFPLLVGRYEGLFSLTHQPGLGCGWKYRRRTQHPSRWFTLSFAWLASLSTVFGGCLGGARQSFRRRFGLDEGYPLHFGRVTRAAQVGVLLLLLLADMGKTTVGSTHAILLISTWGSRY